MRIAFYAPLKSPNHPVPSGDRRMAQLLIEGIRRAGHEVELASELRAFIADPNDTDHAVRKRAAEDEIARIAADWTAGGRPDLWFCYHPYYKAPDLIGPRLSARFGIPYMTAEASWSPRRFVGPWAAAQAYVLAALRQAALNICFTHRDLEGLQPLATDYRLAILPPFIDTAPFRIEAEKSTPPRIVALAMMRPGDKLDSYRMLGRSLARLKDVDWTLRIIGDGPQRAEVAAAFEGLGSRVEWLGEQRPEDIPRLLAEGDLLAWPGHGEAFGLAYLEAQAVGLPVVAQRTAGVPEVVLDGTTGVLTPQDDEAAYAAAVRRLIEDKAERERMGAEARSFVLEQRSLERASMTLRALLSRFER